jgi:hypothetical protein
MAGGDGIEPPLPARVAATESSRPGSDDSANRPRDSGLADRCDAVCPGTVPTLERSFALSISGPGSLVCTSGLPTRAAVPSAMSAGTTTTTPSTAISVNSDTAQERSPPGFRSVMARVNRPESMGIPPRMNAWKPIFQVPELSSVADAGETLTIP